MFDVFVLRVKGRAGHFFCLNAAQQKNPLTPGVSNFCIRCEAVLNYKNYIFCYSKYFVLRSI